jgi:superfamily II DNA or RNA helicase
LPDLSAQVKFKRGHLPRLIEVLNTAGIPYLIEKGEEKPTNFVDLQFSHWLQADERDYQRNAVEAFLAQGYGIIKVPTRGGKTVIASEIIRQITERVSPDINILFLTDLTDLFNQTVEELERFLLEPVGEMKGEFYRPGRITVAMTQTLQSRMKKEAPKAMRHRPTYDMVKKAGVIIIDECHDFVSKKRLDILRIAKTECFLGLSGTPEKSSNMVDNLKMKGLIGDVVYDIKEHELEERGILAKSRVLLCLYELVCDEFEVEYNSFIKQFVYNNDHRNFLIATMAHVCVELGLKVLIMTRSKEHGKVLSEQYQFEFISGDDDPFERKRVKKRIIEEEGGVATVVTEIWKKGITLPQAQVLINVTVGREESNVIQKRGRILGSTDIKKKALTIDIIDFSEYYLSDHSYERIDAYSKFTAKENIEIIDSKPEQDFLQRFYEYVNDWFYE